VSETQEETQVTQNGADGDAQEMSNVLEQIRQRRRSLFENRQTYLSIPGYEEIGLVAQYHLLDGHELNGIVEKVRRQTKDAVSRGINSSLDILITACDGLFLFREGEYVPFDPGYTGSPLDYNQGLAEFVGYEANSARQVVQGLFGNNDAALAAHAMKLQRWFQNTTRDADQEFLGEM
jgi:hypothetical protein